MSKRELFPEGVAIVIGGSGGIGRAVCEELARAGSDIAFTYRSNAQAAGELTKTLEASGRRSLAIQLELSDRAGCRKAIDAAASEFGRIHTLVLCVGADISMTYTADIDPDEWDRTIAGDLTGSFNVLMPTIPHLRKDGGSVLAMSSAGLKRFPPKDILSVVPKAGVEMLINGIAREEGRNGIRGNCIALGVIDTGLFKRLEDRLTPQFVEAMRTNAPLQRFATAEEVADLAVFLCSSRASFITGQNIALDGGYSI